MSKVTVLERGWSFRKLSLSFSFLLLSVLVKFVQACKFLCIQISLDLSISNYHMTTHINN